MQIPRPHYLILLRVFIYTLLLQGFINNTHGNPYVGVKVSVIAVDLPLNSILKKIEDQTAMRFIYSNEALDCNEKISVNFINADLDEVLFSLFNHKGIIWEYRANIISLKFQRNLSNNHYNVSSSGKTLPIITGKVIDENNQPIPGATVHIKGSNKGTQTNTDGSFSLSVVPDGAVLVITSLGYERKEVSIGDRSQLIIKLLVSTGMLNEKVVIAYGVSTRRTIVGNVASIGAKQIATSPVTNPLLALQGRVPGIFITQANGYAGSGVSTIIQGKNSLKNGTDPFYVIDGVPYVSQFLPNWGGVLGSSGTNGATNGSPLNLINPADIESITILKDAEATSIYGSRAANGAILITTKKGSAGPMKIDIGIQRGWQKASRVPNLLNRTEFLQMRREALKNDGLAVSEYDYDINGFWDTTRSTNWFKELLGHTGQYTNVNGSTSGGGNNIQYRIAGTYNKQTTIIPGDFSDQRGSINVNLNTNSTNQKFHFQFNTSYLIDDNKLPGSDVTSAAFTLSPTAPNLFDKNGKLNWALDQYGQETFYNPLRSTYVKYNVLSSNFIGNSILDYNILPGLSIRSSFGYNSIQTKETIITPLDAITPSERSYTDRSGLFGNNSLISWIVEPQITYSKNISKSHFDILLGSSYQHRISTARSIIGTGFTTDDVIEDINAATKLVPSSSYYSNYKYSAIFGRVSYNLDGKYLINVALRRDGTSKFGSSSRFHNFGSVGAGWIFSKERLFNDNMAFISFGKLRGSYGITGSDQIPDYTYLSLYNPLNVNVAYRGISSLIPTRITNPYLKWEETRKVSVGLDLGILDDKILIGVTRNINGSYKQLVSKSLPSTAGLPSVLINLPATIQNSGWEITVESKNIHSKSFSWYTNFNLTIPRNKLVSYPNLAASSDSLIYFVGRSISTSKVLRFGGVNTETGVYQFFDRKGALTSSPSIGVDNSVFLDLAPKLYGGIENSFTYQNVSLNFLFQFVKRSNYTSYFGYKNIPGVFNQNQPREVLDRWRKEGDNASHQKFNSNYSTYSAYMYALASDKAYSNASFVRLKNVSLSFRIPNKWKSKLGIRDFNVSFQAQNLITITKFIGADPELGSMSLPPLKTYVVAFQLGL